jgi:hypothetical protein
MTKDRVAYVEIRFNEGAAWTKRDDCDRDGWFTTVGLERQIQDTLQDRSELDDVKVTVFFLQDQVDDEIRAPHGGD